jgi:chemotaxis protein methyltransferase CheR
MITGQTHQTLNPAPRVPNSNSAFSNPNSPVRITPEELKVFSKYIHSISGVLLDDSKTYLLENRFAPLLRELNCSSFSELYYKTQSDPMKKIQARIIDAIVTGETSFFRDSSPFELLQHKILPDLIDQRTKKDGPSLPVPIRIWSAACSTGQEVYTIGIVLKELLFDLSRYQVRLIGTDISDAAIARASYGRYNRFEMERGLPRDKLVKYFTQEAHSWKIKDEIRGMATFRKMNLMDDFNGLGRYDIILCRNVAIYFSEADRIKLFSRIGAVMERDGYLIIGSTESLNGICPQFEPKRYLKSVFYQLTK